MIATLTTAALFACGGVSVRPDEEERGLPRAEEADLDAVWPAATFPNAWAETFDAPIRQIVRTNCVLLEDETVECWGTFGVGHPHGARVARRARWRPPSPIAEIVPAGAWTCARLASNEVWCAHGAGEWAVETDNFWENIVSCRGFRTPPCAPDDEVWTSNDPAACVLTDDGSIECHATRGEGSATLRPTTTALELVFGDDTACARLAEHAYECWRLPIWDAIEMFHCGPPRPPREGPDPRVTPTYLGRIEDAGELRIVYTAVQAIAASDPHTLRCIGGCAPIPGFAGAVEDPTDPWARAFLGTSGRSPTPTDVELPGWRGGPCTGGEREPRNCVAGAPSAGDKTECRNLAYFDGERAREGATRISFDGETSCDLTPDGRLECRRRGGSLAARVDGVVEHVAGPGTLLWIDATGQVWCAGENGHYQCGSDGPEWSGMGRRVAIPPAVHVCAGALHACAVTTAGAVWCWGDDVDLQVTGARLLDPDGAMSRSADEVLAIIAASAATVEPTEVWPSGAIDVACGALTTCVALVDGRTVCW